MIGAARPGSTAFYRILNRLPFITEALLGFSDDLFSEPLCLLALAANQFAGSFLNLSRDVFSSTLDLVFVHFQHSLLVDYTPDTPAPWGGVNALRPFLKQFKFDQTHVKSE
jgi:hypothetical protein